MVDFKKFDPKFHNEYPVVGPEFGELEHRKEEFIKQHTNTYRITPYVPKNILGLTSRLSSRIPANQNWFIKTGSFERNGFFNIHTPVFNTKVMPWAFFLTVVWGNVQFVWQGLYEEASDDNYEFRNTVYDKLNHREIPLVRIWQRPG